MSTVLNFASAMVGLAFAKSLADNRERKKNSSTATVAADCEAENDSVILKDNDAYDVDAVVAGWVVVLYSIFTIFPSLYMFLVEKYYKKSIVDTTWLKYKKRNA